MVLHSLAIRTKQEPKTFADVKELMKKRNFKKQNSKASNKIHEKKWTRLNNSIHSMGWNGFAVNHNSFINRMCFHNWYFRLSYPNRTNVCPLIFGAINRFNGVNHTIRCATDSSVHRTRLNSTDAAPRAHTYIFLFFFFYSTKIYAMIARAYEYIDVNWIGMIR